MCKLVLSLATLAVALQSTVLAEQVQFEDSSKPIVRQAEDRFVHDDRQGRDLFDFIGLGTGPDKDPYVARTNAQCINGDLADCFKARALSSLDEIFTQEKYDLSEDVKVVRMPHSQLRSLANEPYEYSTEPRAQDTEFWSTGKWTKILIRDIRVWHNRKHGTVNFYISQFLSGHGCFRSYLGKRRLSDESNCVICGVVDTPEHTFFQCVRWIEAQRQAQLKIGVDLTVDNIVNLMLENEDNWKVEKFLKTNALEVRIPEEVTDGGRYAPRFLDEVEEELDIIEDKRDTIFSRKRLRKLFIPFLIILKLFKLKLLLFLPLILGLASFKKFLTFLAIAIPGFIGYLRLCKTNQSGHHYGNYFNPAPQYAPNGVGAFSGHYNGIQPGYGVKEQYGGSGYFDGGIKHGGVSFSDGVSHGGPYGGYGGYGGNGYYAEYRSSGKDIPAESGGNAGQKKSILPDS